MKAAILWTSLVGAALCIGCGSSSEEPGATTDGGTDAAPEAAPDAPDAPPEAAPDAPEEAGPCDPLGVWEVTYEPSATVSCIPSDDTVTVAAAEAGTSVTFDIPPPIDGCSVDGGPVEPTTSGSIDGCTISASWSASWCTSGEGQCQTRELELTVTGDTATGTLSYSACWFCGGSVGSSKHQFVAHATRK